MHRGASIDLTSLCFVFCTMVGFASDSAASPASYSPAASVASTFASTTHNAKLGFEPLTQLRKSETISSFVHTAASLTRPTSSLERGSSSVPQLA